MVTTGAVVKGPPWVRAAACLVSASDWLATATQLGLFLVPADLGVRAMRPTVPVLAVPAWLLPGLGPAVPFWSADRVARPVFPDIGSRGIRARVVRPLQATACRAVRCALMGPFIRLL